MIVRPENHDEGIGLINSDLSMVPGRINAI